MDQRIGEGNDIIRAELDNLDNTNSSVGSSLSSSLFLPSGKNSDAGAEELPLSFVARAERQLQRNITLAHDGSCAVFTKEDIERIHDSEVLKFLSRNAPLFSRYMHHQPASSVPDNSSAETTLLPTRAEAVEAQILRLQQDIETFITAVDEEGTKYHIVTNEQGNLVVPLEEIGVTKDEEDNRDEEADVDENMSFSKSLGIARSATSGECEAPQGDFHQQELVPAVADAVSPFKKGLYTNKSRFMDLDCVGGKPKQVLSTVSPTTSTTDGAKGLRVPRRRAGRWEGTKFSRNHAEVTKLGNGVRPLRALQAWEEARVADLLKEDFSSAPFGRGGNVGSSNPFHFSSATSTRLAEIDNSLEIFSKLRAPLCSTTSVSVTEPALLDSSEDDQSSIRAGRFAVFERNSNRAGPHTSELGNAYMRTAIQQQLLRRQLRNVNKRLACNRRHMEKLPRTSDIQENLLGDMQELRPEWAKDLDVRLPEDKLQQMIAEARDEATRAAQSGLPVVESREPPLPYFQQHLRDVKERALRLLEEIEQNSLFDFPTTTLSD
ncbi:unnamed protein product [Phytomonas sp. EM1]|nr:unnamed protein product [Phytomonas sp. EM1]|eukprot:CCW65461.1 unnamed protein product [Phytomonas sp. isolate EM1]